MMIKNIDRGLYTANTRAFSVFKYISAYKRPRTPIKLTYKVEFLGIIHKKRVIVYPDFR